MKWGVDMQKRKKRRRTEGGVWGWSTHVSGVPVIAYSKTRSNMVFFMFKWTRVYQRVCVPALGCLSALQADLRRQQLINKQHVGTHTHSHTQSCILHLVRTLRSCVNQSWQRTLGFPKQWILTLKGVKSWDFGWRQIFTSRIEHSRYFSLFVEALGLSLIHPPEAVAGTQKRAPVRVFNVCLTTVNVSWHKAIPLCRPLFFLSSYANLDLSPESAWQGHKALTNQRKKKSVAGFYINLHG